MSLYNNNFVLKYYFTNQSSFYLHAAKLDQYEEIQDNLMLKSIHQMQRELFIHILAVC